MDFKLSVPVTHVLHIGAGCGAEAEAYAAAGLDPVVLADADPAAAGQLQALAGRFPAVRGVQAAVTARKDARTFFRTNFADLNSLSRPEGLRGLFPGLEVLAEEPAEPVSPLRLLDGLDLPEGGAGLLVLETPGETMSILAALAEAGRLTQFSVLRIQEGLEPLYEGAPGMAAIRAQLRALGYDTWMDAASSDPDRPHVLACRSRAAAEAETLAVRVAELEADTQRQAQELEEATSARDTAQAEAERLAARVAELEADTQRQAQELEEAASARGTAQAEAERLAAWAAELEAETAAGVEARKAAEDRAGAFEAEARQAQQNLAVALRLQNRREADLKELQKRYSALLQRQEAQEDLLRRTGACLGYLMDDSAPEEARPVPAAAAVALRSGGA